MTIHSYLITVFDYSFLSIIIISLTLELGSGSWGKKNSRKQ